MKKVIIKILREVTYLIKVHKRICIVIICFVILGMVTPGCRQQETELQISKDSIQEAVVPDSSPEEKNDPTEGSGSGPKQAPSAVQFSFYPSGSDFIKSIIDKRGEVVITEEMRERFNLFARDYRFFYLPDLNYYESFFEANPYAQSFGHNNFGFAVFYVLSYMGFPEKMSAEAMQNAIQSLFVAKDSDDYESNYQDMPHQVYGKLANYQDGYYSPRPEGGLDHDRMFYLLTGLHITQEGPTFVYITVRTASYYFNDPSYRPGVKENWLAEKSKELGIPDLQAAAKLIANGEIAELKGDRELDVTIRIKFSGNNPYGYNPRFVSSQSRDLIKD